MLKPSHELVRIHRGTVLQIMAFGRVPREACFILDLAIPFQLMQLRGEGRIQIQLDLRNVQDLWFFQALLHSFPGGKSQLRLYHDQHRVLPPAQPGPEEVTQ